MAKHDQRLRELDDDELVERAGRDQAGAVQPAVPARHRPARQHRRLGQHAPDIARINTELRDARDRGRRGAGRNEETADG